jgi:hypothetical protein
LATLGFELRASWLLGRHFTACTTSPAHSSSFGYPFFPTPFVKKSVLFPMYVTGIFVESKIVVAA